MAPEAIVNQQYSGKSDVWSFGAMIYELMEEQVPYAHLANLQVAVKVTTAGLRLHSQPSWPLQIGEIMRQCHQTEANDRPEMAHIRKALIDMFTNYQDVHDSDAEMVYMESREL